MGTVANKSDGSTLNSLLKFGKGGKGKKASSNDGPCRMLRNTTGKM
jgi:hypothetical protein